MSITENFIWGINEPSGYRYDITPKSIFEFLKTNGNSIRKVPNYQRPYSWEKNHVLKLLDDIDKYSKSESQNSSWFLGTIFTTKTTNSDAFTLVLDGQQRLTTIQILLVELILFIYHDDSIEINEEIQTRLDDLIQAAKECLYVNIGGNTFPRFQTEESTNELLNDYLISAKNIRNRKKLNEFTAEFETKLTPTERDRETPTLKSIRNHIKTIRLSFREKFVKKDTNENEFIDLGHYINYFHTLLHKIWLIEIPLKDESFSLEIFEGINNRGKSLGLIDKLQFRSLSKKFNNQIGIRNAWKEIFLKLEDLIKSDSKSIFQSQEEFYKLFFLSIRGKEFKDEEEFLTTFEDIFLVNEDKLNTNFFEKIRVILEFFKEIDSPFSTNNNFCNQFSNRNQEKEKVTALLHLLKRTILVSGNSRQLIINLIYNYNPYENSQNYIVINGLWNIIRLIFTIDIIENHKSNAIRSHINKICKKTDENYQDLKKLFKIGDSIDDEDSKSITSENLMFDEQNKISYKIDGLFNNNIICNSSNEESLLILFVYTYLKNRTELSRANDAYYKRIELEHVFPKKWKDNWRNKLYTTQEIKILLNSKKENSEFKSIHLDGIISDLDRCDFELNYYDTKPDKQEHSLIEWVGNKLCLHKTDNITISNFSFENKKIVYFDSRNFIIPNSMNSDSLPSLNDFGAKEIVDRSIEITKTIINNLFITDWEGN
jgi:hypothetical protein